MTTESEIKKMKRGELNALAVEYGINPDDFSRADDLRTAIFDHRKQEANEQEVAEVEVKDTEPAPAKTDQEAVPEKSKPRPNPPRPRIERRSKRYRQAHEQIDKSRDYDLAEAIKLAQKTSTVSFDATVELHVNLGVDPRQSDQLIRGSIVLPHGSGKTQKVAVIAPDGHDAIKKAGADRVGYEDILKDISQGNTDFDILVAHQDVMRDLSKHAKVLGPQGLMPSPKSGTVTNDPAKTVKELKAGRIEYRVDRYGIVHQPVGRVSFKPEHIKENIEALMGVIKSSKPASIKGVYLKKVAISTSMGPGIKVDTNSIA